ncbi:sodium- and chloride-dependent GABA transporter 2-like [Diadema setosum]|uniref:sodium- and chloride-dependent GABA transporter 2-like n=1 Tax=Diadema setosum TaxID=31175 RepID=UPI003B3B1882
MMSGTNFTCEEFHAKSPVEEFWENKVIQISSGLHEMGGVVPHLALSLFLVWTLCYFCIWKGVKWTGKVVYFTATFPYIVLIALLIRGVTLPGAANGLLYYVKPDLRRLRDGKVWMDGGTQIFYSYAIGLGACISLGSYNKYHHNVYRDSMILAATNSFTSLLGGVAIFSVLGYMSHEQGVPIDQVASKGPGLAFIAYPRAIALMPLAPFWAVVFFIMILMVGLDSQFVTTEGFVTAISDLFPHWIRKPYRRELFVFAVCMTSYLIALSMVTRGGMYVFQIFDTYAVSGMALLWLALFEAVAIGWAYGADRFYNNITEMVQFRPIPWFKYCWMFSLPGLSLAIWIFSITSWSPMTYDDYEYPLYAETLGFCLALSSMLGIPAGMLYKILRADGTIKERLTFLIKPAVSPIHDEPSKEDLEMMTKD